MTQNLHKLANIIQSYSYRQLRFMSHRVESFLFPYRRYWLTSEVALAVDRAGAV